MVDPERRMSFSKNHVADRSEVTQGGVEGTQGTQDPPLELYSTPKTMCRHPTHNGTGACALFRSHSTSSQDLDKSRGVRGFDRWHREFPHWLSLSMDVGLSAVSCENSQPIEGGRDVQFNVLAVVQYLEDFVRAAPDNIEFPFMLIFRHQHPPSFAHFRHSNVSVHL